MTDEIPAPKPDDEDDDGLVLPESALDDALDTVRRGAEEYEHEVYRAGLVDGAEQLHHLLTELAEEP